MREQTENEEKKNERKGSFYIQAKTTFVNVFFIFPPLHSLSLSLGLRVSPYCLVFFTSFFIDFSLFLLLLRLRFSSSSEGFSIFHPKVYQNHDTCSVCRPQQEHLSIGK